jgi:hypothetical protein
VKDYCGIVRNEPLKEWHNGGTHFRHAVQYEFDGPKIPAALSKLSLDECRRIIAGNFIPFLTPCVQKILEVDYETNKNCDPVWAFFNSL